MPEATVTDIEFDTEGLYGTVATYASSDTSIIANDGTVTRPEKDTEVTINATYKNGGAIVTKAYTVKVLGTTLVNGQLLVGEFYTDEECSLSSAAEGTYRFANPFNKNVINGLEIYNGATIEFDVKGTGSYLSSILSFQGGGRLYFTGGSYLGYNALGGYFDANVKNTDPWAAGTDFINGDAHIKINITSAGFEVYANDVLAYSLADLTAGNIKGSNAVTSFSNVLKWLNNTAETIDFGWGSWWADKFNGTISNVKLYVTPADEIDTEGYVYYDTFSQGNTDAWTVTYDSSAFSFGNDGDSYGNYVSFTGSSNPKGNRSALTTFALTEALTGGYMIEADFKLAAGTHASGSQQFVITGEDFSYVGDPSGGGATSGYILKLATTGVSTTYTVNDGSSTVTIPSGTWVHVSAIVDTEGDVKAVFTYGDTVQTVDTEVNGNGSLGGLYLLRGRAGGSIAVDNVRVSLNDTDVEGIVITGATEAEATVAGTAYPDKNSTVTVTFTSAEGTVIADTCKVLINGTEVTANSVVNMVTVKSIAFNDNVATVTLDVAAINGWHSVVGSYAIKLMNGTVEMSNATVEYALEMSSDTAYTEIAKVAADESKTNTSAYYKLEGTKLYVMSIFKSDKIHCDAMTAGGITYGWYNGIAAEMYMTLDGTVYNLGSHVYNGLYANPITWNNNPALIQDGTSVVRSYMALGTFDNDDDVDTGCILLNVVDLADIGLTEDTLAGKTVTFSGFVGPNDFDTNGDGSRFVGIDATQTYTLAE